MTFFVIVLAIVIQIFLSIKKVSPFISLLLVAIITGFLMGMSPEMLLKTIEKGVSSTLGGLVLVICFGAMLGKLLEISRAAEQISTTLINAFGIKKIQWAVLLASFSIGIPLFYNAGFVILIPLIYTIAQKTRLSLLYIAIPMAAGLSVTHCFLPPHPSPVVLVHVLKANMGKVLLYGIIIAIPTVILAGPLFGMLFKKTFIDITPNSLEPKQYVAQEKMPGVFISFFMALFPVLLITLAVCAKQFLKENTLLSNILLFIGDATIALFIAVILAIYFFGIKNKHSMYDVMKWCTDSINSIAMILLIITAGGVFKQVLIDSGTATYITSISSQWQMSPLVFGWLVTSVLRVAIGSASVAGITAAGIVSPLVASGTVSPELMVLAVGTGSVFGSHINDSGFWMFKEFFRLSLKQTFLSWTMMETIISILGLIGTLLLSYFI
jgi:Gnt-I system high-affinity gluconate transporter